MNKKNLLIAIILLLLSVLFCFAPLSTCEAAETPEQKKVIVIPAEQLTSLEAELNVALKAIENSKANSTTLKNQLMELQKALSEAQKQSTQLKKQLTALTITSTQQRQQLESANQSLQTLSIEMKKERKNLERQRNVAYVIAAGMMYLAVKNA